MARALINKLFIGQPNLFQAVIYCAWNSHSQDKLATLVTCAAVDAPEQWGATKKADHDYGYIEMT